MKRKTNSTDGPSSPRFRPILFQGNIELADLPESGISELMAKNLQHAPFGDCICWGIPFNIDHPILLASKPVTIEMEPFQTQWIIFMHTADISPDNRNPENLLSPLRDDGPMGKKAAGYIIEYSDGSEISSTVKLRHQVAMFSSGWGNNCFQAVSHIKPELYRSHPEDLVHNYNWGFSQTHQYSSHENRSWLNWIWCLENPQPEKTIVRLRFEPTDERIIIFGISAGHASSLPIRWNERQKALISLPKNEKLDPILTKGHFDDIGRYKQVSLDLGQVISLTPQTIYPNQNWSETDANRVPKINTNKLLMEYTAHPDANLYFSNGSSVPVSQLTNQKYKNTICVIPPAHKKITVQTVENTTGRPVPVKIHIHGEYGEYLPPVHRSRQSNSSWFQDYSADFCNEGIHLSAYVEGEIHVKVPLGKIYVEITKGFEIKPVRQVFQITPDTTVIEISLEKILFWREKGWITADTHVHFLSPATARLEGAAEGVNIINLLASQWGEMMTNVGDFDGQTTYGSRESGGDGEYLVRVGTENRQHYLGHISLLGYKGDMITPLCSGGVNESALGDPVETLLMDWAAQCKKQGGIVVLPHYPTPRCEHGPAIINGDVDGIEICSGPSLYAGISPYSLVYWYRYLNCGYKIAAVGGTDKMTAATAVGTVRTYAYIGNNRSFTYERWMEAVSLAQTFATYGPLLEFSVDGHPLGSTITTSPCGGQVAVEWKAASAFLPMTRVELIVNGEIKEQKTVNQWQDEGKWMIPLARSSWMALLIRGKYENKPEMIAAHSSPIMVKLKDSPFMAAADAVSILEEIEGALAYIDTIGTRTDTKTYKRMRLSLVGAHRELHNRLHQIGAYHHHTPMGHTHE